MGFFKVIDPVSGDEYQVEASHVASIKVGKSGGSEIGLSSGEKITTSDDEVAVMNKVLNNL